MTAVVLIPAPTPPLPEDAHLTLVWAGEKAGTSTVSRLQFMARSAAHQYKAFPVKVMGTALFGDNHNEPVLLCELTSQIALMRAVLRDFSQSAYGEFRPHVAVPKLNGVRLHDARLLPQVLYFNQIALWAAEESTGTTWWLGS